MKSVRTKSIKRKNTTKRPLPRVARAKKVAGFTEGDRHELREKVAKRAAAAEDANRKFTGTFDEMAGFVDQIRAERAAAKLREEVTEKPSAVAPRSDVDPRFPEIFGYLKHDLGEARDYALDAIDGDGGIDTDSILYGIAYVRKALLLVDELAGILDESVAEKPSASSEVSP